MAHSAGFPGGCGAATSPGRDGGVSESATIPRTCGSSEQPPIAVPISNSDSGAEQRTIHLSTVFFIVPVSSGNSDAVFLSLNSIYAVGKNARTKSDTSVDSAKFLYIFDFLSLQFFKPEIH